MISTRFRAVGMNPNSNLLGRLRASTDALGNAETSTFPQIPQAEMASESPIGEDNLLNKNAFPSFPNFPGDSEDTRLEYTNPTEISLETKNEPRSPRLLSILRENWGKAGSDELSKQNQCAGFPQFSRKGSSEFGEFGKSPATNTDLDSISCRPNFIKEEK